MVDAASGLQDSHMQDIGKLYHSRQATRFQAQYLLRRILLWVLISELRIYVSLTDGVQRKT
jgi:hypothetical protein